MKKFGLDISKHQGDIDIAALKGQVDFIIIRAGYSNTVDPKFERNYNLCKELSIPVGAYWYSYALNVASAKDEANSFLNALKGKQFEYPVYLDMEDADSYKKKHGYNFNNSKAISEAFCSVVESAGYYTGIYASKSWFDTYLKGLDKYTKWIAHWSNVSYENKEGVGLHQYTSKCKLKGYSGNLDADYAHVDFPTIIKQGGFNGYSKGTENKPTKVVSSKKSNEEIANEVINGQWGNGNDRKNKLTAAGYNYNEIQSIVNQKVGVKKTSNVRTHRVAKGENLSTIAKKYGTTWQKIYQDNKDKIGANPNVIRVGTILTIK